jgi:hypothetical protein
MNFLDLAASPILSGVLGGIGAVATGILGFFQKREDNKFALAITMAYIEETKQAGILAALREKGAGEAFTTAIEAEGKVQGEHRWATTVRSMTRPGLTWLYQVMFLGIAGVALLAWFNGWAGDEDVVPLVQYIVIAVINSSTMTLSFWFGQRGMDKMTTSWGNKTTKASVSSK